MLRAMTWGRGRSRCAAVVAAASVLVAVAPGAGAAAAPVPVPADAPAVADVIVSYRGGLPPRSYLQAYAAADDGAVVFASGAGYAASLTAAQITALTNTPGVAVTPNRVLEPAAAHHDETGATAAWAQGTGGDGQTIVVIDTGVDTGHPNLTGKVVAEACFTPRRATTGAPAGQATRSPGDCPNGLDAQLGPGAAAPCTGTADCSHGTAVSSVAVANGPEVWGTAPGASIVAVQVFSSVRASGERVITDEASLVRALEWVEQVRTSRPLAAVNLSLGGAPVPTPCTASPALTDVIDRLVAGGTAVVSSAGNDASRTMLSFPACLPNVVSVAAEGTVGSPASFANRAPQVTLFAPGEGIDAAWSRPCCTRAMSGSSFAAPQVAAAFALLAQRRVGSSVAERVALLQRTGQPLTPTPGTGPEPANSLRVDRALDPQYRAITASSVRRNASPIGALDVVESHPNGVRVAGWAIDPDTVGAVTVHIYVNGRLARGVDATATRTDVAAVYRGYGAGHGYDTVLDVPAGSGEICVYGLDQGPGEGNVLIGCRRVEASPRTGALDVVLARPRASTPR